jgi:hypothetical protein
VALFAENPTDGIYYVGLAATIGPDDAGGAGAAEGDHGPLAEGLETYNFDFTKLKQGVPFCREQPLRDEFGRTGVRQRSKNRSRESAKRDDFSFLEGRIFLATLLPVTDRRHTRLAGSLSEAQPPGAKMAVRKKSVAWGAKAVKHYSRCGGGKLHTTR